MRGRKGANNVFFAGRVQGRRLEPGVYMISISPNRRLVPGAPTEYVKVVSRRRSVPLQDNARKPSCDKPAALASDPTARLLIAEARLQPKADAQAKAKATAPIARPAAVPSVTTADEEEAAGAAGALPDAGVLGVATDDPDGNPIAAIAILTVVGALLIAMLALVTRFVRGSWNP